MFKIKFRKQVDKYEDYDFTEGMSVLKLAPGTIVTVRNNSPSNVGDIVIRTNDAEYPENPLRTIKNAKSNRPLNDGNLWGRSLGGYSFQTIRGAQLSDYEKSNS